MSEALTTPGQTRPATAIQSAAVIITGTALMALAAKVQIPFWPVPMTLHTLGVMAFAVAFGPRAAVSIFASYLALGAAGLPVFSGSPERGIGVAYLMGPTGGYLLGYLIASGLVGYLAVGKKTFGRIWAMLVGMIPIYGLGVAWLAFYIPSSELFVVGVAPFLLGDLVKICVVAAIGTAIPASISRRWSKGQ
ncbi:biotin transporter BioY [Mesorhizobium sp. 1B3]|uniref:biotin transporter BioY n=1 Tax=Mesorhizobium sp. 1B3 TaxID=3243599 RepID=UPI003D956CE9